MLFQPCLRLFHGRRLRAYYVPESWSVITLDKMSEFMDNDVIDNKHWRLDQPPVQIDIVFQSAGTPAITTINDLAPGNVYTKTASMQIHSRDNFLFSPADIPFAQGLSPLPPPALPE